MRRVISASSGSLWKALAASGTLSSYSSSVTILTQQHHRCIARTQALQPPGLKLYATFSDESVGSIVEGDAAATLAMEFGSVPASQAAAMLENHTNGNVALSTELITHLATSTCYNNAATLRTCTPSELSRSAFHFSSMCHFLCRVVP